MFYAVTPRERVAMNWSDYKGLLSPQILSLGVFSSKDLQRFFCRNFSPTSPNRSRDNPEPFSNHSRGEIVSELSRDYLGIVSELSRDFLGIASGFPRDCLGEVGEKYRATPDKALNLENSMIFAFFLAYIKKKLYLCRLFCVECDFSTFFVHAKPV